MANHAGGISLVAFVVAVGVSMGYYQFMYIPAVNAKPVLPEEVLNPSETFTVTISEGSSNESNGKFFVPKDARTTLEINNRVAWQNNDITAHTVTSDDGYVDKINGDFDTIKSIGLVSPGETWEFTFTAAGNYPYHCEPHPWMQGSIEVIENFS